MKVIVLMVNMVGTGGTPSVSSVTDLNGLTWTKRSSITYGASSLNAMEIWYAIAPKAQFRNLVTATFTGDTAYATDMFVYGSRYVDISGNPWDANGSLPATSQAVDSTQSIASTISTTATRSMLVSMLGVTGSFGAITRPTSFATIISNGGTVVNIASRSVTAAQSSATETYSWTGTTTARAAIFDALKGL